MKRHSAQWISRTTFFLLALVCTGLANATYIVDTGPGPQNIDIFQTPSVLYSTDQWLGFQLDIEKQTTITGVEGWLWVAPGGQGEGRLSIYSSANDLPDELLFSDTFFGAVTDPTGTGGISDWLGALDLDWKVKKGSYWITFESGDLIQVEVPGAINAGFFLPSPNPQNIEAFNGQGTWITQQLGLGVRVTATKKVPEPGTLSLFAAGLLALGFMRRRIAGERFR